MEDLRNAKIGELVAKDYRLAGVFKKFGLDFCCGGGKTIADACMSNDIAENELINAINELNKAPASEDKNYNEWDAGRLVDHIVDRHHTYVTENLPLLLEFSQKVARVHGEANPEVVKIAGLVEALAQELTMHMHKEEFILFPYIKELSGNAHAGPPPFGTVANPIRMMLHEHDSAGDNLKQIRKLSSDYSPPEHACNTYRVLYAKLEEFENDLHQHIHLENNILFQMALRLEEAVNV